MILFMTDPLEKIKQIESQLEAHESNGEWTIYKWTWLNILLSTMFRVGIFYPILYFIVDKVSKLEKRLEDLEKLIEERLPSLQESIISGK